MAAVDLLILVIIILCSPLIARELRRITVSIASELKTLKDEVSALNAAPVATQTFDASDIRASIADLSVKLDALTALVGTPVELYPPA